MKGADEPYVTDSILDQALAMNIPLVIGDDSHGLDTVGLNIEKGINVLEKKGISKKWKKPVVLEYDLLK